MDDKTTFQELLDADICFSVCVAQFDFKIKSISDTSKDYFILALDEDTKQFTDYGFRRVKNSKYLAEHDMTSEEIEQFKAMQDRFNKIIHDKTGRIYELKNKSFSAYFEEKYGDEI